MNPLYLNSVAERIEVSVEVGNTVLIVGFPIPKDIITFWVILPKQWLVL
jgi:hypothetical protein